MKNEPEPPDAEEEYLREIESLSQQVVELSQQLTETAMARVSGWRRIDLRAIKSLDWSPGQYQISISEPEDPQPVVTLDWRPGQLILGADLVETQRDVRLPLPAIRETVSWPIPLPPPGKIPPPPPAATEPLSVSDRAELRAKLQIRNQAWEQHHHDQTRAARERMTSDQAEATADEEKVAEAMVTEIEARRANPKENAGKTILNVAETVAAHLLTASRSHSA